MKTEKWFFMRNLLSAIWRLYFHPAKFDNFIDEKMSQLHKAKKLAGLKTCLANQLSATFESSVLCSFGQFSFLIIEAFALKRCMK